MTDIILPDKNQNNAKGSEIVLPDANPDVTYDDKNRVIILNPQEKVIVLPENTPTIIAGDGRVRMTSIDTADFLSTKLGNEFSFSGSIFNLKIDSVTLELNGSNQLTVKPIDLSSNVTGLLPISSGGTGAASAFGAKVNLALDNVDNTSDVNKPVSTAQQASIDAVEANRKLLSSGMIATPALVDNANGTINLASEDAVIYNTATWTNGLFRYTIPAINNLALADNDTNYVIVNYNSGSPVYQSITNVSLINESDIIPVYTIYRESLKLHILIWDNLANGMTNRLHARFVKTRRFERLDGLATSEFGTRNLNITAGTVWYGANEIILTAVDSTTDSFDFYFNVSGVWNSSPNTQWNNTQYDNGTDLVTIANSKYGVVWLYRGVEMASQGYMVQGSNEYTTVSDAENAEIRADLPEIIQTNAILVAQLIFLESAATLTDIRTPFTVPFSSSSPTDHNNLSGLQLAGTGVIYGHIDNQTQSITGVKSFISGVSSKSLIITDYSVGSLGKVLISTGDSGLVTFQNIPISDDPVLNISSTSASTVATKILDDRRIEHTENQDYPENYRVLSTRTDNIIKDVANDVDAPIILPVSKFDGVDGSVDTPTVSNNIKIGRLKFKVDLPNLIDATSTQECLIGVFGATASEGLFLGSWTGSITNEILSIGNNDAGQWRSAWASNSESLVAGVHSIDVEWTGITYTIKIDGNLKNNTTFGTPAIITAQDIRFGARLSGSNPFNGGLFDIEVYDETKTLIYDIHLPHLSTIEGGVRKGWGYDANGDAVRTTVTGGGVTEGFDVNGSKHLIEKGFVSRNTELVVNGDFSDGLVGWVNPQGGVVVNEKWTVDYSGTYTVLLRQDPYIIGGVYVLEFDVIVERGSLSVFMGNNAIVSISSSGHYKTTSSPLVSDGRLSFAHSDFKGSLDNITSILATPDIIPNNNEGQPITPLVEGDTFVSGARAEGINISPHIQRLFVTGDTNPSQLIWDQSNVLIWKQPVRDLPTYDLSNTGDWRESELNQAFIDANVEPAFAGLVTIIINDGQFESIIYSDDLVKILNRNPHKVVSSDIEDFNSTVQAIIGNQGLQDLTSTISVNTITIGISNGKGISLTNISRTDIDNNFSVTQTGTIFNATSALQINGTDINTGAALNNVAYLDQANSFTTFQEIIHGSDAEDIFRIYGSDNITEHLFFGVEPGNTIITSGHVGLGNSGLKFKVSNSAEYEAIHLTFDGNLDLKVGSFLLNGTDINAGGALSNVAYKNQANVFTADQTISKSGITTLSLNSTDNNRIDLDFNQSGTTQGVIRYDTDKFIVFEDGANVLEIDRATGLNVGFGGYQISGTTVIDASRNIVNAGSGSFSDNLSLTRSLSYNSSYNKYIELGTTTDQSVDIGRIYSWRNYVSGNASGQDLAIQAITRGGAWSDVFKLSSTGAKTTGNHDVSGSLKILFNDSYYWNMYRNNITGDFILKTIQNNIAQPTALTIEAANNNATFSNTLTATLVQAQHAIISFDSALTAQETGARLVLDNSDTTVGNRRSLEFIGSGTADLMGSISIINRSSSGTGSFGDMVFSIAESEADSTPSEALRIAQITPVSESPSTIGITTTANLTVQRVSAFDSLHIITKLIPTAQPSSPSRGWIYSSQADSNLYYYNGSTWDRLN